MLKKIAGWIAVLAILVLTGCAGPGQRKEIALTVPPVDGGRGPDRLTIVVHDRQVPTWLLDRDKLALNYLVKGPAVSEKQLAAVKAVEGACREYSRLSRPHPAVTIGIHSLLFGITNGFGLRIASEAYRGTRADEYWRYGSVTGAVSGAASGLVLSGDQKVSPFEDCGEEVFFAAPRGIRILR